MHINITNTHDKLFKEVYGNKLNAASFLENYLPEKILQITNLDSLELCKDSFIGKDLQEFYSDMLYKVNFKTQQGYIYCLFEHKSYPDKLIHLQLLEYMLKIWRLEQGLGQGLEFAIDMKFGDTSDTRSAISMIKNIKNIHQLKAAQKSIKKAKITSELIKLINC